MPLDLAHLLFTLLLGSLPFAITFVAFSIANSQFSEQLRDDLTGLLTRRWPIDSGSRLVERRSALSIGVTIHRDGATLRQTLMKRTGARIWTKAGGRNRVVTTNQLVLV